jgi:histone H3/H4
MLPERGKFYLTGVAYETMPAEGEDSKQAEIEEDVATPIKPTSLKKFVKHHSDKRAGSDAVDLLQSHLEFTAERLWLEAGKHAEDEGKKTVQEEDVQHAIDQLTEPHDLIKVTADKLEWMKDDLARQVEQSILYAEDRYDR